MRLRLFFPLLLAAIALNGCGRSNTSVPSDLNSVTWEQQIQNPNLTEDEFTRLYAQAVGAVFTNATVKIVGKRELSMKFTGGNEQKAFLDNAWIEAANNPTGRVEIVRRYLKALTYSTESGLPNTNRIVPVIRGEAYVKQIAELGATTTNRIVWEPLAADLDVVYAIDGEGTITFLREDDWKQLGFDLPALRKLAIQNLRRLMPELKRVGDGPTFMLVGNGNYESSLLLADGMWANEAKSINGEIVAAVPARDMLIFTGSQSPDGLKKLRQVVEEVQKNSSHLISNTILVRRNGKWEKFSD